MMEQKIFGIRIRIDAITPAHLTFSIFTGMVYDLTHTLGRCGQITERLEESMYLIERLRPDAITLGPDIDRDTLPIWLRRIPTLAELVAAKLTEGDDDEI